MNSKVTAASYLRKSEAALKGAKVLLKASDADGASSRAYYAMFEAAHAALIALGFEEAGKPIKTHNVLIALFGKHIVQESHLDASHGEALNAVQRLRLLADYTGDAISREDAAWAVDRAEAFVKAVRVKLEER